MPSLKLKGFVQQEQSGAAAAPEMKQPVAPPQPLQHARSGDHTRLLADFDAEFSSFERRFEEASTLEPVQSARSGLTLQHSGEPLFTEVLDGSGKDQSAPGAPLLIDADGDVAHEFWEEDEAGNLTVTGAQGSATFGAAPQPSAGAVGQPPPPPPPPPRSAGAAASDAGQPRAKRKLPQPVKVPRPKKRPQLQPVQDPQANMPPKPQGPAAQKAPETQGTQACAEPRLELYRVFMTLHKEGFFQDARLLNTEVALTEQEKCEHLLLSQSGVRVPHYWANWWLRILRLKDHGG